MEFPKEDHDRIIATAAKVNEHERRLQIINGNLERIAREQSDTNAVLSGLRSTIKTWGVIITAGLSGLTAVAVWAITST